MGNKKASVCMGQGKRAKTKKGGSSSFKGAMHGKSPAELQSLAVAETRKAAEGGDSRAMYLLGFAYAEGSGVQQSAPEAFRWLMKAAENGLSAAQCHVAVMLFTGTGCTQNKTEALRWWQASADAGEASAQYNYGLLLFYGEGVEQDKAQGFRYLQQAAKQGVAEASARLRTPEMLEFAMQC